MSKLPKEWGEGQERSLESGMQKAIIFSFQVPGEILSSYNTHATLTAKWIYVFFQYCFLLSLTGKMLA